MLKEIFIELCNRYTSNLDMAEKYWQEIERSYADKSRHYHDLTHLKHLFKELAAVKSEIEDWDMVLFAMYYHDMVYSVLHTNNEAKSSRLAKTRLLSLGIPEKRAELCKQMILATKSHERSENKDINLFIDADLAILGKDETTYQNYTKQVRKEYAYYPDFVYNPGRKEILNHFLDMASIYKTITFIENYEQQAKENISNEILNL